MVESNDPIPRWIRVKPTGAEHPLLLGFVSIPAKTNSEYRKDMIDWGGYTPLSAPVAELVDAPGLGPGS